MISFKIFYSALKKTGSTILGDDRQSWNQLDLRGKLYQENKNMNTMLRTQISIKLTKHISNVDVSGAASSENN